MPTAFLILALVAIVLAFLYGNTKKELEMLKPPQDKEETALAPVNPVHVTI